MKFAGLVAMSFVGFRLFGAELVDVPEFDFGLLRKQAISALNEGRTNEAVAMVEAEIQQRPTLFKLRALLGELRDGRGEYVQAIKAYSFALDLDPGADALFQRRGECHYRLGEIQEALDDFDALLMRNPKDAPGHWQRGIALYDLGRFADSEAQFKSHETVNGADCETALWHWLAVARQRGTNAAIQAMIPFDSADIRPPMLQLHALYAGKGSIEAVLNAARVPDIEAPEGKQIGEDAKSRLAAMGAFYANLYLGLYGEACGDRKMALKHLELAVKDAAIGRYMGDVAKVAFARVKAAPGTKQAGN